MSNTQLQLLVYPSEENPNQWLSISVLFYSGLFVRH